MQKVKISLKLYLLVFLLFCFQIISSKTSRLLYPISFGIVRHSSINVNFETYMKNIGYPNLDSNGNNLGYNIISLDGFKTPTTDITLNSDLSPLGTWTNVYSRIIGNTRSLYGKSSTDIQKYIAQKFHQRGSKILMNAFSFQRPISQQKANATLMAQQISQTIQSYNFDGVSIQFDDFNSVKQKTASQWLKTLLKTLRKLLGKDKIISLIIYPTFIKEIDLFKSSLINSYVNFFVIKYFNVLNQDYSTFQTLFNKANKYNNTSLWQIQQNSAIKIDICKVVIAKPSSYAGTWNNNAFLSGGTLNNIFQQARTKYSWFCGYANMDFGSDSSAEFQMVALNSLRTYCYRYQTCYCK